MKQVNNAQQAFDIGILALGIELNDQQVTPDKAYAKLAFQRAVQWDADMCDAWLGLLTCGDDSDEVIYNIFRTSNISIFREQRRLNLPAGILGGKFYTGYYLDYPLTNLVEAWCAQIARQIEKGDFAEAARLLEELRTEYREKQKSWTVPDQTIVTFMEAVLNFQTKRWSDVLEILRGVDGWVDQVLRVVAELMWGISAAHLGLLSEAERKLTGVDNSDLPAVKPEARFYLGLVFREKGEEDTARAILENIYAENSNFPQITEALFNTDFRLPITTKERIAARADKWVESAAEQAGESAEDKLAREKILATASETLDKQIGLAAVKEQITKLKSAVTVAKLRAEKGLGNASRSQHLVFLGPPGTGKTTIAKVVAQIYHGLGVLPEDKVVEVSRRDLVGQYLGSTAIKTGEVIKSALGGVLFIDEAYTLIQEGLSGGDAFGQEAVDTLLAAMENHREELVVIIAGYQQEIERLLASNEGLASRFARRIEFHTYSAEELTQIAVAMAKARDSLLAPEAVEVFRDFGERLAAASFTDKVGKNVSAVDYVGNARFVRNVVEAAEEERELRLVESSQDIAGLSAEVLMTIREEDLRKGLATVANSLGVDKLLS